MRNGLGMAVATAAPLLASGFLLVTGGRSAPGFPLVAVLFFLFRGTPTIWNGVAALWAGYLTDVLFGFAPGTWLAFACLAYLVCWALRRRFLMDADLGFGTAVLLMVAAFIFQPLMVGISGAGWQWSGFRFTHGLWSWLSWAVIGNAVLVWWGQRLPLRGPA